MSDDSAMGLQHSTCFQAQQMALVTCTLQLNQVSLAGAFIGMGWGFALGFVIGWVFAFCRNVVTGLTGFVLRTRAELQANRGFLDQI